MKSKISPKSAKPSAFWSRKFSRPAKPAKPAVFGIRESIKHKFRVFQVYRSQNWYQSNTPLIVLISGLPNFVISTINVAVTYASLAEGNCLHKLTSQKSFIIGEPLSTRYRTLTKTLAKFEGKTWLNFLFIRC